MKKTILAIIMMVCLVATVAGQRQITFGQIDPNGLSKVTKGAMWAQRPWAKMAYFGQKPEGVDTITLMQPHFAQFADGENNRRDINFIPLNTGTKICFKDGEPYLDYCGNKLKNLWPVNSVRVIRDTVLVEKPVYVYPKSVISQNKDLLEMKEPDREGQKTVVVPENTLPKKKSNFWKIAGPIIGAAVLSGAGYLVWKSGGPAIAPLTKDYREPYIPPTDGPGGAPTTR